MQTLIDESLLRNQTVLVLQMKYEGQKIQALFEQKLVYIVCSMELWTELLHKTSGHMYNKYKHTKKFI